MKNAEETKNRPHSFRRGYDQLQRKDVVAAKKELMEALGLSSNIGFYNRLNGKVIPKVTEAEIIEGIFAKYGVIEVWGR